MRVVSLPPAAGFRGQSLQPFPAGCPLLPPRGPCRIIIRLGIRVASTFRHQIAMGALVLSWVLGVTNSGDCSLEVLVRLFFEGWMFSCRLSEFFESGFVVCWLFIVYFFYFVFLVGDTMFYFIFDWFCIEGKPTISLLRAPHSWFYSILFFRYRLRLVKSLKVEILKKYRSYDWSICGLIKKNVFRYVFNRLDTLNVSKHKFRFFTCLKVQILFQF